MINASVTASAEVNCQVVIQTQMQMQMQTQTQTQVQVQMQNTSGKVKAKCKIQVEMQLQMQIQSNCKSTTQVNSGNALEMVVGGVETACELESPVVSVVVLMSMATVRLVSLVPCPTTISQRQIVHICATQ